MTPLLNPVHRRTVRPTRGNTLVVSLLPGDLISVRPSGTRKVYALPIEAIYHLAVRTEVALRASEKRKAKKARAKGRTS